jgi:mono/diheme cytochrome c family protein
MAEDTTTPPGLPPVTYAPRPPRLRRPPFLLISVGLVSVVASWVPLVLFARARTIDSDAPRVSYMQDMGSQPKFREQQSNTTFADFRADRLPVPGTVARGKLEADDHYYRGYTRSGGTVAKPQFTFYDTFPENVKVDKALLERGQQRFNIYCSACHGYDGHGHGAVNERAMELQGESGNPSGTTWTQAADLTTGIPTQRPVGHIYNTINVGIRSMPSYGAQITDPHDRWAIVAYVRALQFSENAPAAKVADAGK